MKCEHCYKEFEILIRYNSKLICKQCHKKLWHNSEMNKLREKVLIRDNYSCQLCGVNNCVLEIHHIIPIKQGGFTEMDNLITLCYFCHREKFHNYKHQDNGVNKVIEEIKNINKFFSANNEP